MKTKKIETPFVKELRETKEDKPQHTPTPWEVLQVEDTHQGIFSNCGNEAQSLIAQTFDGNEKANAEFIVRAVNCHEELLAASQALLSELRWTSKHGEFPGMDKVIAEADKAIAKASASDAGTSEGR